MRKQKRKLNPLSDMRGLQRPLSDAELQRMQRQRILKNSPHQISRTRAEQPAARLHKLLAPERNLSVLDQHALERLNEDAKAKLTRRARTAKLHTVNYLKMAAGAAKTAAHHARTGVRHAHAAGLPLLARLGTKLRTWQFRRSDRRVAVHTLKRGHGFSWRGRMAMAMPALSVFVALMLLVMSVFPVLAALEQKREASQQVLGAATSAYEDLKSASDKLLAADLDSAHGDLTAAYQGFNSAITQMQDLGSVAVLLPQAAQGQQLLYAAQQATLALQYFTGGMQSIASLRLSSGGINAPTEVTGNLVAGASNFKNAVAYLQLATQALSAVDFTKIPEPYRTKLSSVSAQLTALGPGLAELSQLQDLLLGMVSGDKQYLLLFENSRELRATGGFIGTYGVLQLSGGRINNLKIESVYNPDGQLKEQIAPPGPMQLKLTRQWAMRDSNWFFDFPQSARKASQFLEKETGAKADGVIAMTPKVFERLLALTGPIPMPAYNVTLNADNFTDTVQYQTSVIYDRKLNQPKKFLADFAPLLLDRLSRLPTADWMKFITSIIDSLNQKDILLASNDPAQQARYDHFNWAGGLRAAPSDFLAVVNSNVGGGKTDQDITDHMTLQTAIASDGRVHDILTIDRTHKAGVEKEYPVNVDFMRIYVPKGSRLVSARGFDNLPFIPSAVAGEATDPDLAKLDASASVDVSTQTLTYEESDKTVFANWLSVPPDTFREVKIEYELPFSYSAGGGLQSYSLLFQKQPGGHDGDLQATLLLPAPRQAVWRFPQTAGAPALNFSIGLSRDAAWGVIFK